MKALILTLTAGLLFLSSCSETLSPYTSGLQHSSGFTEAELQQIQFYVSDDIVLQRYLSGTEKSIEGGVVKMVNGREVEEIMIPAGTPGVVTGTSGNILHVSFDNSGHFLRFGLNPGAGGKYTVMAYDWQGSAGYVQYGDLQYRLVPYGRYAHLLLDMERYDSSTTKTTEVSGRTLSP
jgi:hypothetical protein